MIDPVSQEDHNTNLRILSCVYHVGTSGTTATKCGEVGHCLLTQTKMQDRPPYNVCVHCKHFINTRQTRVPTKSLLAFSTPTPASGHLIIGAAILC
jgi:hypothetical protein